EQRAREPAVAVRAVRAVRRERRQLLALRGQPLPPLLDEPEQRLLAGPGEDALLERTAGLGALFLRPEELLVVHLRLLLRLEEARHRQHRALLRRLRGVVALAARA